MKLFSGAWTLARFDADMLRRSRSMAWAVLGVVLIPALYALIYLEAVWDPASRTGALPALIVDLDEGAVLQDQRVRLGADVVRTLQARKVFAFQLAPDEAAARREVRSGRSLFVLVIPRDFTASALSAERPGSGRLMVYASEGNHYAGAGLARRFAADLGHQVNEAINERRWAMVLGAAAGTGASLQELRAGVAGLHTGARAQADGLRRATEGAQKWNAGAGPVLDGVR
jgi:putative membrane protein